MLSPWKRFLQRSMVCSSVSIPWTNRPPSFNAAYAKVPMCDPTSKIFFPSIALRLRSNRTSMRPFTHSEWYGIAHRLARVSVVKNGESGEMKIFIIGFHSPYILLVVSREQSLQRIMAGIPVLFYKYIWIDLFASTGSERIFYLRAGRYQKFCRFSRLF